MKAALFAVVKHPPTTKTSVLFCVRDNIQYTLLLSQGEWTIFVIALDSINYIASYTFKPLALIHIEKHLDYLAAQQ